MKQKKQTQKGRTMTEMLAVLFIIGILSMAILVGFTYAMEKYHANETVNEIRLRASDVIYNTLHHGLMAVGSEWKPVAHNDKPISYDLNMSEINDQEEKRQPFTITVDEIAKPVCTKMLDMGFTMPYKIEVNNSVFETDTNVCNTDSNNMKYFFVIDAATASLGGNDDGAPCDEDDACQSGVCQNNVCVECKGNWDCPPAEVCDTAQNVCVECMTDADCDKGTCENNVCMTCAEKGCPDGTVCDDESGKCVVCRVDEDCPGSEVCDTKIPRCVECLDDEDCEGSLLCDTREKKCVECFTNADCPLNEKGYCNQTQYKCELCKGRCVNIPLCPQKGDAGGGVFKICESYQPIGRTILIFFADANGNILRSLSVKDTTLAAGLVFADIDKSVTQKVILTEDVPLSGSITNLSQVIDHINSTNTLFANRGYCSRVTGLRDHIYESCSFEYSDVTTGLGIH